MYKLIIHNPPLYCCVDDTQQKMGSIFWACLPRDLIRSLEQQQHDKAVKRNFKKRNRLQDPSWKRSLCDQSLSNVKQRQEEAEVNKKRLDAAASQKVLTNVLADVKGIKEGYRIRDPQVILAYRKDLKRHVHAWRVCLRATCGDGSLNELPPRGSQFHEPLHWRSRYIEGRLAEKTVAFACAVDTFLANRGYVTGPPLDIENAAPVPQPLSGHKQRSEDEEVAEQRTKHPKKVRQDAQRLHCYIDMLLLTDGCNGDGLKRSVHQLRVRIRTMNSPIALPMRRAQYDRATGLDDEDHVAWVDHIRCWNLYHPLIRAPYYRHPQSL